MGFLDQLFGKKETPQNTKDHLWKNLTTEKDLDAAISQSFQEKVLIFKHSTRCFISKTVLKRFENQIHHDRKLLVLLQSVKDLCQTWQSG